MSNIGMTMGTQWVVYYSAFPHTPPFVKKILVLVSVPSWATTLVPFSIPYGYLSVHTRTHYSYFNYEKTIKTSQMK